MDKEFEILLYGASSFTADFIIPYFENLSVNVGLAARNIQNIRETNLPKIQCTLVEAALKTQILINCVGPYHLTGEECIKSCLNNNTHYIDICGEVNFIRYIYDKYNNEAARKKLFIIQACGFNSLIADMGTDLLRQCYDRDVEIKSILEVKNCTINFGSWQSLLDSLETFNNSKKIKDKYIKSKKTPEYMYDTSLKSYIVKFQSSDYYIVSLTQKLLKSCNMLTCNYIAYVKVDNIFLYFLYLFLITTFCKFKLGKKLLLRFYKFFSKNFVEKSPSIDKIKKGSFKITFESVGMKNVEYISKNLVISGPDPYTTTGICVSQSALVLKEMIFKRNMGDNVCNFPGGVLTPGFVFRNTKLPENIESLGISINLLQ